MSFFQPPNGPAVLGQVSVEMMSVVIGQALDSGRTEDGNQLQPKRGRVNIPEMIGKCEQVRSGGDRACCAALLCCNLLCWHAVPRYSAVQLYYAAVQQYSGRCTAPHIPGTVPPLHCCAVLYSYAPCNIFLGRSTTVRFCTVPRCTALRMLHCAAVLGCTVLQRMMCCIIRYLCYAACTVICCTALHVLHP